jgi:glyoxylase-like metal-dependent hydrolase (beta-lactamase superfamily II)
LLLLVVSHTLADLAARAEDRGAIIAQAPRPPLLQRASGFARVRFALIATAVFLIGAATRAAPAELAPALVLTRVAPGVYVQLGDPALPSPANRGRVANRGVLVGPTGIVLVNTGASREDGEALIAAATAVAPLPVVAAIATQATPDQVLGNAALAGHGIPVIAHRATDRFMVQNCTACIHATVDQVGAGPLSTTRMSRPSWLIDHSMTLELGGRTLELLDFGWTVQPGAIAVLDRTSGVLFAGNLADFDVLPEVRTARLEPWLEALRALRERRITLVVPGHGPIGAPSRLDEVATYLTQLGTATTAAYRNGVDLARASATIGADRYRGWAGYERLQPSNVHFVYLGLERADLDTLRAGAPTH